MRSIDRLRFALYVWRLRRMERRFLRPVRRFVDSLRVPWWLRLLSLFRWHGRLAA